MSFKPITDCTAVILAGGKNSRYGGFHKAFLRIGDEFIIERDLKMLKPLFRDIIIVANDSALFGNSGVPVFEDIYKEKGPLGGIHSALVNSKTEAVLIFGCDMPFLDADLIKSMYNTFKESGKNYCIPRNGAFIEPLHAFYSKKVLAELDKYVKNQTDNSVKNFVADKDVCYMDIKTGKRAFFNINSPEDLAKIL